MTAENVIFIAGFSSFVLTITWVYSRRLRERYAIGWLLVSCILLVCGLFPRIMMTMADAVRMSYASLALLVFASAGYIFLFSVSVSLSRMHRLNVRLTQKLAIMESELRYKGCLHEPDTQLGDQDKLDATESNEYLL